MPWRWSRADVLLAATATACVLVPVQLRRLIRSVRSEDTSTWLGVGRLSVLSKLAYLLGWDMPACSQSRFLFYAASMGGEGDGRGGADLGEAEAKTDYQDILQHLRRRRISGSGSGDADEEENSQSRASTLVVAFAGGAVNKVGIPRAEFRRTLQSLPGTQLCDQLYVHDPSGMSFYSHGQAPFLLALTSVVRAYDKVVFVGNCMGATAVLRFAYLLPSAACTAIAVNPEVEPWRDWTRPSFLLAALLLPRLCLRLRAEVGASVAASRGRVHVHASAWRPERAQAELLLSPFQPASGGEGDGEGEAGGRDEPPLLFAAEDVGGGSAAAACAEALRRAAGRRAVLFRHSHDRHGLISGVLRPGGGLAALLEEAVSI